MKHKNLIETRDICNEMVEKTSESKCRGRVSGYCKIEGTNDENKS